MAVSPTGKTVFVTGTSPGSGTQGDYTTIAYNAATGAQQWVSRYNDSHNRRDVASALAVSPDGTTVFVTGSSMGATINTDYATVAYNAVTGAQRWVRRYDGPAHRDDSAFALALGPGGHTVYVTGGSKRNVNQRNTRAVPDYATIAYNAATGAQRWVSRYEGLGHGGTAFAVAAGPGGHTVYVTGENLGVRSADYATVAYSAATGARRWARRYGGPGATDSARSIAVGPGGHTVYVTGQGGGFPTVAYNAATGARRWSGQFNGDAAALAVSPGGGLVFVTGTSGAGAATIAYRS